MQCKAVLDRHTGINFE